MFTGSPVQAAITFAVPFVLLLLAVTALSIHRIGPNQVGLVIRRWGPRRGDGGPIAFHGEAGYQADLLMPGLAVRVWPVNRVEKHPWVQIGSRQGRSATVSALPRLSCAAAGTVRLTPAVIVFAR